jgi:hypothetical protein
MCPHSTIYVSSYYHMCFLILLHASVVRSVLKLNPTANAKKTHALVLEEINGVQSRMLFVQVYLCSRTITAVYVSSYGYACVLMLL